MMSTHPSARADGATFMIHLSSGEIEPMTPMTFAEAGLGERTDLQRWLTSHPELLAPDLLLITTEFDRWEIREQTVADRLDALFLDTSGAPVVAELKRDRASDTVELQALKYAAYCAQLTLDELAEEYAAYHGKETEESRQELLDHAPLLEDGGLRKVKIRLLAGSFGPAVTSVVLWLRDYGLDIGCVEVSVRRVQGSGDAVVSSRQLLPLAEAEDYLVRRRRKEQEEERDREGPADWTWDRYAEQLSPSHLAVARSLFDQITRYVTDEQLPWTPVLRSWWLGYQRPGGYYVPVISLRVEKPIEFCVKLPDAPERLGLVNPYPNLRSSWNGPERQWQWQVPTAADVPDVRVALDLSRRYQPERGPMPRPEALPATNAPLQPA